MNTVVDNFLFESTVKDIRSLDGENPEREAEELFIYASDDKILQDYIIRRTKLREPTAYIVGKCKFRGLDLIIDARALVPRPETELLVEAAIDLPPNVHLVDVGTGSGAVALAIKNERPDIHVSAIDISKEALDLASINSEKLGLFIDLKYSNLLSDTKDNFYAVTANLPYLPKKDIASYPLEMIDNEPEVSLWGGQDGYVLIDRLLAEIKKRKHVSMVALEVGKFDHMAEKVMEKIRDIGFDIVYGIEDRKEDIRVVVGKKK